VTAEGISIAMHSAHIAARAILEARIRAKDHARDVEHAYVRGLRREVLSELRIARLVAHVLYRRPRFARALFDHAGTHLCEAMADVYLGRRTYKSLVTHPRNWWRLVSGR
jgi:flavin-dependent dehydrogenase